jgi:DNA polymerase-3 subunit epsilon
MREVVLDTETTGLDPKGGHRIVEIGCIELLNHMPTGRTYHSYVNPERSMPTDAFEVHGLSEEFLSGHPVFADVAAAFLAFIEASPLVIHNARFDLGFLDAELARIEVIALSEDRAVDTVELARRKFPGAPANLDALCRRFGIDNANRTKHGALLDAELLAGVYMELQGGRQPGLGLSQAAVEDRFEASAAREKRPPRDHAPSESEAEEHGKFLESLTDPVWRR